MAAVEHVARAATTEVDKQVLQHLQIGPQHHRRGHGSLFQAESQSSEFVGQMAAAHEHVGVQQVAQFLL